MTSSLLKLPERQALERNRQYMYPSDEETDNDNGDFSDQEDGFDDREIERSYVRFNWWQKFQIYTQSTA